MRPADAIAVAIVIFGLLVIGGCALLIIAAAIFSGEDEQEPAPCWVLGADDPVMYEIARRRIHG